MVRLTGLKRIERREIIRQGVGRVRLFQAIQPLAPFFRRIATESRSVCDAGIIRKLFFGLLEIGFVATRTERGQQALGVAVVLCQISLNLFRIQFWRVAAYQAGEESEQIGGLQFFQRFRWFCGPNSGRGKPERRPPLGYGRGGGLGCWFSGLPAMVNQRRDHQKHSSQESYDSAVHKDNIQQVRQGKTQLVLGVRPQVARRRVLVV